MNSKEYKPSDSAINAVISSAIIPIFEKIEADLAVKLDATLTLERNGLLGPRRLMVRSEGDFPKPVGEVRIRFRKTFIEGRSLFQAEAIFDRLPCKSDFSGFMTKGEVFENEAAVTVKPGACTIRRNMWEWMGWS